MHYLIFPKQDAWIYSKYPTYNYGLDEILEIRKDLSSSLSIQNSRILIQFDLTGFPSGASQYFLNLYAANPINLAADYTIEAFPISSSWTNGTGFPASSIRKYDGASWVSKSSDAPWTSAGGDFISTVSASQVFSYNLPDVRIDVTSIVSAWQSGLFTNNGFLLRFTSSQETSPNNYGRLTFYSMDTHTVNVPTLEALVDNYEFITGSTQLTATGYVDGYLYPGGVVEGQFSSASGMTTAGGGNIQASFAGTAMHFVTESLSSSLSQSLNILTTATFSGSSVGVISGSISGTMNSTYISATLFTGSIDGTGTLSGSYTGSAISGSVVGNIISVGTSYMYISGNTSIYVSGAFSGSFIGNTSNGSFYFFESVVISGSSDQSGSVTGSYDGTGIITFDHALATFNGEVSGNQYLNPPATIKGIVTNNLANTSFEPLLSDQIVIVLKSLRKEYKYNTTARIRLVGKDQYQRKTFLNTAATQFSIIKYLPPNNTWYSIVDAYTGRIIIPFSNYTKVNCDLFGNYFDVIFSGMMPERFYKLLFKVTFDGVDSYFDNNYIFKVVK
jgi:hypothetical protein